MYDKMTDCGLYRIWGIWDKKGDIWVKICKIYEKALDF